MKVQHRRPIKTRVAELRDRFYRDIGNNIDRYGWHLMAIFGDDDGPQFIYTIGNHDYGLPELISIGCPPSLFNSVCKRMHQQGRPFTSGELINMGGKYSLMALDAGEEAKASYTVQVGEWYQTDDYSVQQIIIPDTLGRYPGDPNCEAPYCRPQFLGISSTRREI